MEMLHASITSLDGLSEQEAAHYIKQADGSFLLDVGAVNGLALENVDGLKNTVSTLRNEKRILEQKTSQFEGLDVQAAREAMAKVEEMKNFDPEQKVAEALKTKTADMVNQFTKEKEGLTSERDGALGQLRDVLVKNACSEALNSAGGKAKLMLPIMERLVQMRKEGDSFIAEVVNEKGEPRVGDSSGNPMTIPQFVDELKAMPDYAPAFDGSGSSGSGNKGGNTPPAKNAAKGSVNQSDLQGMSDNLEDIAAGKVTVNMGE
jgi:hypothetical protein